MQQLKFTEVQRFRQWWLYAIVFGLLLLAIWGSIQQLVFKIPFGNNPAPNAFLIGFLLFTLLLCALLITTTLKTTINSDYVSVKFGVFSNRRIPNNKIASASVIDYGFVGGWGIRFTKKYGRVYSTSGSKGVLILLKSGQKLVIGTQKTNELKSFLQDQLKFSS